VTDPTRTPALDHFVRFDRVSAVKTTDRGLLATVAGEQLRVDLVRADIVRVKISRSGVFDESPSFAVCVDPLSHEVEFTVDSDDGVVRLRGSELVVSLWLDPFALDVHRSDGSAIAEAVRSDDAGASWSYATLNDAFAIRRRRGSNDAIFGLGEKTGGHNRTGRAFTLWNTDVLDPHGTAEFTAGRPAGDPRADPTSPEFDPYYVSIPLFYHQSQPGGDMMGSFIDNGYRAGYDFRRPDEYAIRFEGGQYTEYLFAGPRMPDILEAYTWLTGRIPLPPMWSLGYHQCRWFRYTQDQVEAIARRHRESEIPCDALWLDIDYMDGYRVFTWDTGAFPDVPGLISRLGAAGFRLVTIIDPGVKYEPGYRVFDSAVERDVICRTEGGDIYIGEVWPGRSTFPDFVAAEARDWWGELVAAHARSGVAGIWNDMNEPATGAIPPDRMRFDHGRQSHERYHNQYGLLMAMATMAGLRDALPGLRTFALSRAGFAGIQRYAANWMGDNVSRWDHLQLSMPMGMGLGVSGQAFVGADVGGFRGDSDAELFLRWMQYGSLTPFFRNHSEVGTVDQYAWAWGDAVLELVRNAIALRYRLLPYIYSAFVRAAETGAPVQRPLVFDHQYDGLVRDIDDEYLFGPDLLVAPVTIAGQTARQVYLPAGEWYDWHTGELVRGGGYTLAVTPMDRIPIYARAGAVVPMWPEAPPSTADHHPSTLELHLFVPPGDTTHESLLQEDDGLTTGALGDRFYRTRFRVSRRAGVVSLRADVDGRGYPEFARESFRLVLHGATPGTVSVNGTLVAVSTAPSEAPSTAPGDGHVTIPNTGESFGAEFDVSPVP
jgi:alpha-glucosidase